MRSDEGFRNPRKDVLYHLPHNPILISQRDRLAPNDTPCDDFRGLIMRLVSIFVISVALLLSACQPSGAQESESEGSAPSGDVSAERIVENIKLEVQQLRQAQSLEMSALSSSDVPGFKKATLTINGRQQAPVLVREDGQQVLLLAIEPVDVSRTLDEVQAARDAESSERREALASAIEGMPARGPADAPVTVVEFSDFQCPYCAQATSLIDEVLAQYPETVKVVFMHYPLPMHDWARPAAVAAQCAAQQSDDAFWTLHDKYFENQQSLSMNNVMERSETYLADTSIDVEAWRTCATDDASDAHKQAASAVEAAMQTGQKVGVSGTPAFYVNGEPMQGPRSIDAFAQRIEAATSE